MNERFRPGQRFDKNQELNRVVKEFSEKIREDELGEEVIDEYSKKIAREITNIKTIKYHQLRKIFEYIRRAKEDKELVLAKAKIAYQNRVINNMAFIDLYLQLIDYSTKQKNREPLKQFNEAIISYFKYYDAK